MIVQFQELFTQEFLGEYLTEEMRVIRLYGSSLARPQCKGLNY